MSKTKTTVIHHSADYDGIFCREIARKFLPDTQLIGWDFGDPIINIPFGPIVVMDLPLDKPFGLTLSKEWAEWSDGKGQPLDRVDWSNFTWIDHHKSAIESHPANIPGYRIDGVAACRLAWQWFTAEARLIDQGSINRDQITKYPFPLKQDFIDRKVAEPLAVRLAGEYDIWDHRDSDADIAFQFGLDSQERLDWNLLLLANMGEAYTRNVVDDGRVAMQCFKTRDAATLKARSFMVEFEGLKFLALNSARFNSNTFAAMDVPATGHDALIGFCWSGKGWTVSLYHAAHRKDIDLSLIAVKHGGGGHRGACGFRAAKLPFIQ